MAQHADANPFNLALLQAVSDWQRGGDAKQNLRRGLTLKSACSSLPEKFRTCTLGCFRQIALPKNDVWELIGEGRLGEKISSWTLNLEVAKEFKGGVPPEGQGYQGVIFFIKPRPDNVILNLGELFRDTIFLDTLAKNNSSIQGYAEGIGRYQGTQSEVVLEIDQVTQEDVYSLGGHSSPFEKLVDIAADIIYGRTATDKERERLLLVSENVRSCAGPNWLSWEATTGVLARTKPKAEMLAKIKRNQEPN